jgi:peptide/nickel transport system substrate-binding protein
MTGHVQTGLTRRSAIGATLAAASLARPALLRGTSANVLRFIPPADVTILDPLATTAYSTRNHGHLCWDTLYGVDANFIPSPQLAEGHVVEDDGKRWTFTLRDRPTFHDGEKIGPPTPWRQFVAGCRMIRTASSHGPARRDPRAG